MFAGTRQFNRRTSNEATFAPELEDFTVTVEKNGPSGYIYLGFFASEFEASKCHTIVIGESRYVTHPTSLLFDFAIQPRTRTSRCNLYSL